MTGIAAIWQQDGAPVAPRLGGAVLERLGGPRSEAGSSWSHGGVWLGHRGLATTPEDLIDAQPLRGAGRDHAIVADARLDNREALLDALGLGRAAVSDAALLLHAYARWGDACVERLVGDFAFMLWDGERRRLLCARDHLGVRPLFYHHDRAAFRAASDIQPLFADARVARRPHRESLGLYLTEDYTERDQTLYEDVLALPPGHLLAVDASGRHLRPYWVPDATRELPRASSDEHAARFRETFREAVRCRLRARGPVAAQVSGGLDSSSIVGETERLRRSGRGLGEPVTLVHVAFPGLACDEDDYSRAVAAHWGLPITEVLPSDDPAHTRPDPARFGPDLYYHPLHHVWERQFDALAPRGVRVLLTGLGGDQVLQRTGLECADALRRGRLGEAARASGLARSPASPTAWRRLIREGVRPLLPERPKAWYRALRRRPDALPPWLAPDLRAAVIARRRDAERRKRRLWPDAPPAKRELCDAIANGYEIVFTLVLAARLAVRGGVELRHPFFDVRLIELLLAMPHEERCGYAEKKPLLRRAMRGDLPELVRGRPRGAEFSSYAHRVLFDRHGAAIDDLFARSRLEEQGIVDGPEARRLLEAARRDSSLLRHAANLASLELWLRTCLP